MGANVRLSAIKLIVRDLINFGSRMRLPLLFAVWFASLPRWASAELVSVPIDSPAPAVRFKIAEPDKDGTLTTFPTLSPIRNDFDQNGVSEAIVDGKVSRHIDSIAGQASGLNGSDLDMEAALRNSPGKSKVREAAIEWLR
jgi:hypothetical protein